MRSLRSFFMVTESNKAYIAMLFIQCVYAGMALFSKAAMAKGMNPCVFVVYRQAFASLALAPFAFFTERKNSSPLSCELLFKIFLVSLFGITVSLNLYYFAISYTSATFAAASTNLIPAITFIMAVLLRLESISIKQWHGVAKVLGSMLCVSGALVFAFVKGPLIKLMNNYPTELSQGVSSSSSVKSSSKEEWVKGCLVMLLANTAWSSWLIMQGIIVTGITYWMQVWVIDKKGPVFTVIFTPLALIITAISSSFLWKEVLYLGSGCGAILLVAGLYCVLWGKNKEGNREMSEAKSSEAKDVVLQECITHQ
ncbi:WAT1-related protein At1g43650 isoform X2 [Diospyros lotus]|uniref:WAT1-related protein At1g43650 isoform X2 n=1 Tax=Diospyros lotus TaxID=55363 RepID=UPI0022532FC7|nr:WAT1-related protein At1g43650 isoform X2 [Diospyros lotus]